MIKKSKNQISPGRGLEERIEKSVVRAVEPYFMAIKKDFDRMDERFDGLEKDGWRRWKVDWRK